MGRCLWEWTSPVWAARLLNIGGKQAFEDLGFCEVQLASPLILEKISGEASGEASGAATDFHELRVLDESAWVDLCRYEHLGSDS